MPRTSASPPIRPSRTHVLAGGNGNRSPEPADDLTRIDARLERLENRLDVQRQRIADLQVLLDRAMADRPIKVKR